MKAKTLTIKSGFEVAMQAWEVHKLDELCRLFAEEHDSMLTPIDNILGFAL